MLLIDKETLRKRRKQFPPETRVELIKMDEANLKKGDLGTVQYVDDIGTIHVNWDCGSTLEVAYPEDVCRRVDEHMDEHM